MAQYDFDLFVIGAGSGGVRAARIAASHGAKVAVAEEHRVGGTCVIRGCVPKKMLVYGAMFAEELSHAGNYGWTVEGQSFDWQTLRDFVNGDVDRLEGLYTKTLESHACHVYPERATITGPNSVKLASGEEVTARYILVATGSWPLKPEFPGNELCITSNEVFHLDALPRRLVIQGAGYIALEFAGVFNALGCEVTIVHRSEKILRGYEEAVVERLIHVATARGIDFRMNHQIKSVEQGPDCLHVD
ncbi:MAG: FAD-dependent oxidoreductase, partial [Rhodobacteraceae bacterium]|nr:FAD-dependent oxidoreductase [Paracoccaceae bacterium]